MSLLDNDEDTWRVLGRAALNDSLSRSFLGYAYRQVADLAEAGGWEAEYPRDVWRMRRLGFDGDRTLRFTGIPQPWLREPAKRWVRWRLSTGLGLEAGGGRPVVAITRFARFLAEIGIDRIDQVDRPVLERYLADLSSDSASAQRRGTHIGLLNHFFAAIRQHRWDTALPPDAMFFTEDYPKREERLPRALAEQVMAQLEHPGNLAKFDDPAYRLITMILMRCGLRVTDALRLRADCLVTDVDGAPYLRYVNHKMKRDALVPIDEQLARPDRRTPPTHHRTLARRDTRAVPAPDQKHRRHPPDRQPDLPDGAAALAGHLRHPRRTQPARAPDPAPVAPHPGHSADQPRRPPRGRAPHSRSRLPTDDRPLRPTARHHRAPPLGSRPQGRHPRPHSHFGPGRAARPKPPGPNNGSAAPPRPYPTATAACPSSRACPHANACLTCPMFLTTPEFLPQHREQRQQTLQLVTAAEARGQQPTRRDEPAGARQPGQHHHSPRPPRSRTEGQPNMRADNSIHLVTAAQQRHELTRAKAIAAMHELDRAGAVITFESVARHAGVSRSWIYTQPDIKDEIHRLRSQHRGPTAADTLPAARQRRIVAAAPRNLEPPQPRTRRRKPAATPPTRQRARSTPRQRTNPTRRPAISRTSQLGNNQSVTDRQAGQSRRRAVDILHEANPQVTAILGQ